MSDLLRYLYLIRNEEYIVLFLSGKVSVPEKFILFLLLSIWREPGIENYQLLDRKRGIPPQV